MSIFLTAVYDFGMTTARVFELFPTGPLADDTIRATIKALVEGKGLRPDDVARAAGMSRSTYFAKMSAKGKRNPFSAGEVASIAGFLRVHVSQLYDGLGGTFVPEPPDGPDGGVPGDVTRGYANFGGSTCEPMVKAA